MSREIKFRAYNKEEGKTYYDVQDWYDWMDGAEASNFGELIENTDWELMQYTGLKANGVEIYEGDILECRFMIDYDLFKEPNDIVEVTFEGGRFRPITDIKRNEFSNHPYYYDYKVIGNIYENKELLE